MFATAVRTERDLGVLSVSLNVPTGHRSWPRRIAASAQNHRAAGAGAGYRCLSGGCSITPSGDWDSGNPTFTLSRGSPGAPPLAPGHGRRFSAMLFSLAILSDPGKASDPEISPLISARCASDTAVRLMAHRWFEPNTCHHLRICPLAGFSSLAGCFVSVQGRAVMYRPGPLYPWIYGRIDDMHRAGLS
jgi:hypothetical protein